MTLTQEIDIIAKVVKLADDPRFREQTELRRSWEPAVQDLKLLLRKLVDARSKGLAKDDNKPYCTKCGSRQHDTTEHPLTQEQITNRNTRGTVA
jgi:hypothetical protein